VRKTLNVPAEIRSEVGRRRDDLDRMADDAIEQALRRLRIPTRRDLDRLNERIDRLAAEVRRANGGAARPRKRAIRK
jgi:polyhydroxyalkanoate synthesis regulator phasin